MRSLVVLGATPGCFTRRTQIIARASWTSGAIANVSQRAGFDVALAALTGPRRGECDTSREYADAAPPAHATVVRLRRSNSCSMRTRPREDRLLRWAAEQAQKPAA